MHEESWEVLNSERVLHHPPFLSVNMEQVRLPSGHMIDGWSKVDAGDYANAFVLNEAGEALVLEGYKHGIGKSSWQMVGGYLEPGEDPLSCIRRELLEETGYAGDNWQPLGSFVVDANRRVGVGHFFLARNAKFVTEASNPDGEDFRVKWVSLAEMRQALQDGRVAGLSFAANIALALLALRQA